MLLLLLLNPIGIVLDAIAFCLDRDSIFTFGNIDCGDMRDTCRALPSKEYIFGLFKGVVFAAFGLILFANRLHIPPNELSEKVSVTVTWTGMARTLVLFCDCGGLDWT